MKPWQKRLLIGLIVLVVLGLLAWPKISTSGPDAPPPAARGPQAADVTAYVVAPVPMRDRIRATGSLLADEAVDLAAEASGRVTRILFEEGSRVRAGQLLLTTNDAELQAQRERLRYRIDLATTREDRQRRLLEIGGVSRDEYEGALGELNVLRAELGLVEAQLAKTQVRAPFGGVIGLRYVSEGAFVTPQTRIATLQRLSPMKLEFSVPERYAGRVALGDEVRFTTAGSPGAFRGEVYAVEPRVDLDTRTLLIRARVANPEGVLLPGAFADIELIVDEIPGALPVPALAVVSDMGGKRVWVVEDGKASQRTVETGIRTEEAVQITDGLVPGDTVLTGGLQAIRPGQPVRITDVDRLGDLDLTDVAAAAQPPSPS
ncbi:MAG: efflux RND transporter periplasmic adaptor subunit, partial [Rhodothermales bacterium]|nr:efflux RND transporter periplasmic adaptor subunit [Rhodothermales bacterium]